MDRNGRGKGSHTHTQARPHTRPRARTHTQTPGWLYVPLTYTLQDFHNRNKFKSSPSTTAEGPAGEESPASTAFPARFHGMRLCAQTYTHQLFFFRGFVAGFFFFFSETRRDFLHVYKISVSAFTLGSKKERERRRTTLRKSLLAAEGGGGGDKSLLFFALPSSPATAAFFFFFHTKASFTHELRTAAKNQRG